jgi:hypothetical protein
MAISSFFHSLRAGYQAEIEDMSFDTDGKNVLRQRLAQRRKELKFLLKMIELSPEMVAVVLHQGMQFQSPAAMRHLLAQESDEFPDWEQLSPTITLAPWAQELVQTIRKEPMGDWFMVVAAGLEFMQSQAHATRLGAVGHGHDHDEDRDDREDDDQEDRDWDDEDGPRSSDDLRDDIDQEAAEADWMEQQGFDRKDI